MASETSTTTTGRAAGTPTTAVKVTARRASGVLPPPRRATSARWAIGGRGGAAGTPRPEPRLRQLMGVCGWAAVLGGVGLVIGIRGFFGVLSNDAPGWYEPAIAVVGIIGIGLTVGAFLTVHRRTEPWAMLGLSSLALVVGMIMTSAAF